MTATVPRCSGRDRCRGRPRSRTTRRDQSRLAEVVRPASLERVPGTLREADSEPRFEASQGRQVESPLFWAVRRRTPRDSKLAGGRRMVTGTRSYPKASPSASPPIISKANRCPATRVCVAPSGFSRWAILGGPLGTQPGFTSRVRFLPTGLGVTWCWPRTLAAAAPPGLVPKPRHGSRADRRKGSAPITATSRRPFRRLGGEVVDLYLEAAANPPAHAGDPGPMLLADPHGEAGTGARPDAGGRPRHLAAWRSIKNLRRRPHYGKVGPRLDRRHDSTFAAAVTHVGRPGRRSGPPPRRLRLVSPRWFAHRGRGHRRNACLQKRTASDWPRSEHGWGVVARKPAIGHGR